MTNAKYVKRYLNVATIARDGLLVVKRNDPLSPTRECIGLYRENAIAVRVIDRSAYDATSRVHAHRQRKTCRIYATAVAFTTCVLPVLGTYKFKVEQTVFRHE